MIGDLLSQQNTAQKASIAELQRAIQDGSIPAYIGLPIIQEKLKHRTRAAAILAGQQEPETVKDQLMASADQTTADDIGPMAEPPANQQGGIPGIQSNLPTEYAGGGIIAFADQGLVESPEVAEARRENAQYGPSDMSFSKFKDWFMGTPSKRSVEKAALARDYYAGTTPPPSRVVQPETTQGVPAEKGSFADDPMKYMSNYLEQKGGDISEGIKRAGWFTQGADDSTPTPVTAKPQDTAGPAEVLAAQAKISRDPTGGARTVAPATPVIQAAPEVAPREAPPPVAQGSGIDEALKATQDKADTTREDLKKLILGSDDSESKLKQRALLAMMEGGFKTAAGTSPYASVNIGAGGAEGVKSLSEGIAQIDADKRARITQLVNLGLKGQELDMELKKLGITKDYYDMHAPLIKAQADQAEATAAYHTAQARMLPLVTQAKIAAAGRSGGGGAAGKSYITNAAMAKELDALEAIKSDPTSASFYNQLPKEVKQALKTDPESGSYQRAAAYVNNEANKRLKNRLDIMKYYGAKSAPSGAPSLLDLE